ncbi:pitrilysin family protein [Pilimelia columellifera]|uniref:Pitrilysin family protein n=1 Tax=Pilimelia columellifera subsp. columellifera TaxID=706583 RepID=A0ABN3NRE6_9ACTN
MADSRTHHLDGGVPVIVHTEPGRRMTGLALAVGFGARHDPHDAGGMAHLLEHLVMSAPLAGGASLSRRIEQLGGVSNATTGPESLVVHAHVLTEDAERVADWICRAVLCPEITTAVLDRERRVVLQELAAAAADPWDAVQDAFLAALFAGHPLGRPVGGLEASLNATGVDHLADVHRAALSAPVTFASAGGLADAQITAALVRGGLGALPMGAVASEADDGPRVAPPVGTPSWPDGFGWLIAGSRGPAATDPRRAAFQVLGHLLGASPASLMYARLRDDHGLAYNFRAWSRSYRDAGAWRFQAGVDTGNGPRVVEQLGECLGAVAADGPPADAHAAAVRQAVMGLVLECESPLDHAVAAASEHCLTGQTWNVDAEVSRLDRVQPAEVAAAAGEVLESLIVVTRPLPGADQ